MNYPESFTKEVIETLENAYFVIKKNMKRTWISEAKKNVSSFRNL